MASNIIQIPLRKLEKSCVLKMEVKVTRELRFRLWLAMHLITLAWWIAGGRVEVKEVT